MKSERGYHNPATHAEERVMVCVGPGLSATQLIHAGHHLATEMNAAWMVVTVDTSNSYAMTAIEQQRLSEHLRLADSLGAKTKRLSGRYLSHEIIRYAQTERITHILVGKPAANRWWNRFKEPLIHELLRNSGPIEVHIVAVEAHPTSILPLTPVEPSPWQGYAASLLAVTMTTILIFWGKHLLTQPDLVMLYLLPIMLISFRYGSAPSVLTAALAVIAYNFFFTHPYFLFGLSDPRTALTIAIFFIVGIVINSLLTHIRRQKQEAWERERQTNALHRLGREVMITLDEQEVAHIIARHAAHLFGGEAAIYQEQEEGQWHQVAAMPTGFALSDAEQALLQWSSRTREWAGRGSTHLPESRLTTLPLFTSHTLGVLALRILDQSFLNQTHAHFVEAFARQASLALDRAKLAKEAHIAALRANEEALRGTLLSMVSHDLRTPLATIIGAGTTMREDGGGLTTFQRQELLESICTEAERMERLITNLLDMVRLESGGCHLRPEWVPFEEMAGSALVRLEKRCQDRQITVQVDESVSLLYVDSIFFEQLLVNLLDNAIKYTPAGTTIAWRVTSLGDRVLISLEDQGAGIPPDKTEQIFEKFVRGARSAIPGSGLGLAMCRGVVRAHGGTISAANKPSGGAEFRIELPHPPLPPDIYQHERVNQATEEELLS
ncbi:MAG: sensor histidine kinase KdpD [Magnetococcales bacterium]|nr:sensor histidine kinase KdpD [Magnetococcales bacterium]